MNEIDDTKPEFYDEFNTESVFSDEQTTMNSTTATMNDLVVTMGGSDPSGQYDAPEFSEGEIVLEKP